MRRIGFMLVSALLFSSCANGGNVNTPAAEPELMTWSDLVSRPVPQPQKSISYGAEAQQIVDIWLPEGDGPHPVVLMIHGGCWQKEIADRSLMNYAAEDLRGRGIAVWNIEYRGVDEAGGGYPGTFLDVVAAAEALNDHADTYNLDAENIVAFGHSAGGHLATWLSGRGNIAKSSPLAGEVPVALKAVINSGGLADLEASSPVTLETCLAAIEDKLTGLPDDTRPDVYSDTSSARLQPGRGLQISVNGDSDDIAPSELGEAFTAKVITAKGQAKFVEAASSGHVELISPGTHAFDLQAELIEDQLK